jgi:hypothetical protein
MRNKFSITEACNNVTEDVHIRLNTAISSIDQNKKLIIYGTNELALGVYAVLKRYGITIEYFIDDTNVPDCIDNIPVKNKYDLLLEDLSDKFILSVIPDNYFEIVAQFFLELGLYIEDDFINLIDGSAHKSLVDVSLLSSRNEDLPGFKIFGNKDNKNAKIIVTLGGSTTDPVYGMITSWSEYLYRKLSSLDSNILLYCGGMDGYSSTQELIKFIRDVVPLVPYLVISYSGINDFFPANVSKSSPRYQRPFIGKRTETFFRELSEKYFDHEVVLYGLQNDKSVAQYWLDNMRIMHCMAHEFEFKFMGILQPVFCLSNIQCSPHLQHFAEWTIAHYGNISQEIKNIYGEARHLVQKYPFIFDYTDIFKNRKNIFIDQYHVMSKGNNIIANNICSDMCRLNLI